MKAKILRVICFLSTLLGPAAMAHAQGTAFTYQGHLIVSNASANGLFELQFDLYDKVGGTTPVAGPVILTGVAVTNGLFTVLVDFGSKILGSPDAWIELGVRPDGSGDPITPLSPRQQLTPTPFALISREAQAVTGPVSAEQLTGYLPTALLAPGSVGSSQLAAGAVGTTQLAAGAVTAAKVQSETNWQVSRTIANNRALPSAGFGGGLTLFGNNEIAVGIPGDDAAGADAGVVQLRGADGRWLSDIYPPLPATGAGFGKALATLDSSRIIIGAIDEDVTGVGEGAAYLYHTTGVRLTTFADPGAAGLNSFGTAVTGVGGRWVVVGAPFDDGAGVDAGAAYIFSTNGTLIGTLHARIPQAGDRFGSAITAVGTSHVLIGASLKRSGADVYGAAYLFHIDGTLTREFLNPLLNRANGDRFGVAVGALDEQRIIIGADGVDDGGLNRGAAFLYHTNGTLLATFTTGMPLDTAEFGRAVAGMGTDRIIVGASTASLGAPGLGAAFIFQTNGTLQTILTNPTAKWPGGRFGASLAPIDADHVWVGAPEESYAGAQAGAAYRIGRDSHAANLIAESVAPGAITRDSLAEGSVTLSKLDPDIGVWLKNNNNYYLSGPRVGIGTNSPAAPLHIVGEARATVFTPTSDRNAKENFRPVNTAEVLAKVSALPLTEWNFKSLPGAWHLGPMAQDFRAVFGLGTDEKHIATVDADGVALAAIQGLNRKLEQQLQQKDAELQSQQQQIGALMERLSALEGRLSRPATK